MIEIICVFLCVLFFVWLTFKDVKFWKEMVALESENTEYWFNQAMFWKKVALNNLNPKLKDTPSKKEGNTQ